MSVEVMYADADPNGLADLLGRLIASNLSSERGRTRPLGSTNVEIRVSDARVAARVRLAPGVVRISNAEWLERRAPSASEPELRISAGSSDLLALVAAPLVLGLPSPLSPAGRDVLRSILSRRVRISGLLRHPLALTRLARLLSVS